MTTTSPTPSFSPVGPVLRVVLYGAGLLGLGYFLIHMHSETDALAVFGEYGRLETAQIVILLTSFGLTVSAALTRPASRPLSVLLAGLLLALVVREHNNYFKDHVGPGAWEAAVALILIPTGLVALKWRKNLWPSITHIVQSQAFVWMAAGVMLALFGQLLDEQSLWDLVLGKEPPYAARRILEESFELAALYFFLVGLIEYHLSLRSSATPA